MHVQVTMILGIEDNLIVPFTNRVQDNLTEFVDTDEFVHCEVTNGLETFLRLQLVGLLVVLEIVLR